jgi:ubiquinone/menaquinone biosynthesis C-methylase UbiE
MERKPMRHRQLLKWHRIWFARILRIYPQKRYEVIDHLMKRIIPFEIGKGKKLLEIGYGIGTDLLLFCEAEAEVDGIDITEEHYRLAKRNFVLHGRECNLKLCDSGNIEFPTDYFDIVYSHGVLHHTPDTVRCISEAYRVLKPGGTFILSLYHTYSAYHLFTILLYRGILKGQLKKLGYRRLMVTVEYGADGIPIAPLVKTYSKTKLRNILEDFRNIQ